MLDARTWLHSQPDGLTRPWLILGKGPSFALRDRFDLSAFNTLGLNHVVQEMPLTALHVIDLEVVHQRADAILRNAGFLVMPLYPHEGGFETGASLRELSSRVPVLGQLEAEGRLVYYNLVPSGRPPDSAAPTAETRSFSAVAALHLLAECGVRTVRTLGIDGGRNYSGEFKRLEETTLLANGRASFNDQFREFPPLLRRYGVDFAPLDRPAPIRVFVGASDREWLPARVLEHSIRRHATRTVQVTAMFDTPVAAEIAARSAGTSFSEFRWEVPKLAGYQGRAIYLDSDMLVFQDIANLWDIPRDGVATLMPIGSNSAEPVLKAESVQLMDCSHPSWVPHVEQRPDVFGTRRGGSAKNTLPAEWNHLDIYQPGRTALLHYTNVPTQPWLSTAHPLGPLWVQALLDAIGDGTITQADVAREVTAGHVRPSLLYQMRQRFPDPIALPSAITRQDAAFLPPYLARGDLSGGRRLMRVAYARALWQLQRTPLYRPLAAVVRHARNRTWLYVLRALAKRAVRTVRGRPA